MHIKITARTCILPCFLLLAAACSYPERDAQQKQADARPRMHMVTREHLFAVEARDESAWIAGFEGTIMHTSDSGATWQAQASPVREDLYDICFVNSTTGWITGKKGTVLHTRDGGKKWIAQESSTDQRLFDACFIDEQTGWIVGTMGTVLHTADGGATWVKQGWNEDRYYNGVFFIDARRGWIVGEYSIIYHTEDGGANWVPQQCAELQPVDTGNDFPPPPPNLYGVCFTSPDLGWITGMDGTIIRTQDGGATWKRLTAKADFTLYKVAVIKDRGWAIGAKGSYLESLDGGTTWNLREDALGTKFWLRDMVFSDARHGWIVGAAGLILSTDTGGTTWKRVSGIYSKMQGAQQ
ncbi:MAG: YCF48-related protein [Pseudomonadota bacterium]